MPTERNLYSREQKSLLGLDLVREECRQAIEVMVRNIVG